MGQKLRPRTSDDVTVVSRPFEFKTVDEQYYSNKSSVSLFAMKFDNISVSTQQCAAKIICFRLINSDWLTESNDAPATDERVAYPCLKARKARCLSNTEGRAMQRKQGWKLGGSGFRKKNKNKKTAETIIYALSFSDPKQENNHGKAKWEKNNKKWRSVTAHDKEAHSSKIKWPTSSATADWSKK